MQSHAPSPQTYLSGHASPPAATPVVRSAALERRLRQRRQEARIRARLACDGAILQCHHASQRPSAPAPPPSSLRLALVVLQRQVEDLQATVAAWGPRSTGASPATRGSVLQAEAETQTVVVAFADATCQALVESVAEVAGGPLQPVLGAGGLACRPAGVLLEPGGGLDWIPGTTADVVFTETVLDVPGISGPLGSVPALPTTVRGKA